MKMQKVARRGIAAGLALLLVSTAALANDSHLRRYAAHNLVSDDGVNADHGDANLKNAWGIAFNPTGLVWVANNATNTSTLYDGSGVKNSLTVAVTAGKSGVSKPTGIVFSGSSDFAVTQDGKSAPSRFIFAGEGGSISGWAPTVNLTNTIVTYDAPDGAIYKGLAIASNGAGNFLYAADFHNGKIDVLDKLFHKVTLSGDFRDPRLPPGYAPFGIQNILGDIYVMYAKQDGNAEDEIAGAGAGFVSVFDANGAYIRRIATRGVLNAPWGIALAPANFGRFSNRLLVGNFGDGKINAYDFATGRFVGQLRGANGRALKIDGLWGLSFGNGVAGQSTESLFFTAGPNDEANGLYGRIEPAASSYGDDDQDRDDD